MALYRPLPFVKHILEKHLQDNAFVVDATLGNGNDTHFIASLLTAKAKIFGFDIQEEALINTKKKLNTTTTNCEITYFHKSHDKMLQYLQAYEQKIDCVIFNLGYLPHFNEAITTMCKSTYSAIIQAIMLLKIKGILIVVCYPGHQEGLLEYQFLAQLFHNANPNYYFISRYQQVNGKTNPPVVYLIEKRK